MPARSHLPRSLATTSTRRPHRRAHRRHHRTSSHAVRRPSYILDPRDRIGAFLATSLDPAGHTAVLPGYILDSAPTVTSSNRWSRTYIFDPLFPQLHRYSARWNLLKRNMTGHARRRLQNL